MQLLQLGAYKVTYLHLLGTARGTRHAARHDDIHGWAPGFSCSSNANGHRPGACWWRGANLSLENAYSVQMDTFG